MPKRVCSTRIGTRCIRASSTRQRDVHKVRTAQRRDALITLPVEFNASARAKELLVSQGIILVESK